MSTSQVVTALRDTDTAEVRLSIVLPARNEAEGLRHFVPNLRSLYKSAEIIVVDDGSTDDTRRVAEAHNATVVCHPYSMGNGAAVKAGARAATGDIIVFMDADGQHNPADIAPMLAKLDQGYDLVVGARTRDSQANIGRRYANALYNRFASAIVGREVEDLTSGFRAARAHKFREFLHLLPNGFSYPTTSTMAFFRSGYPVGYVKIHAEKRIGKSHIKPLRDGLRFLLIIFKVTTLYSPLKIFVPFSILAFVVGFSHYLYTYLTTGRFTNMSALLFIVSVVIFLIGLVSEQITMLTYQRSERR